MDISTSLWNALERQRVYFLIPNIAQSIISSLHKLIVR